MCGVIVGNGALRRPCVILALLVLVALKMQGQTRNAVVADEAARQPLPGASVFDCSGKAVGICGADGRIPHVPDAAYPLIVRCLGFRGCLIMLVNDRAEIFQTDLFLWRRSIAGYATEAKG